MNQNRKFYRINHFIRAGKVRVLDELGKQIGIMALNEALSEAQKQEKDLVEIAPSANPPVCKIIDFKKFKYLEDKKQQKEKRKNKRTELKEIRLAPFIAENDLNFRTNRAVEFLTQGNKVKITIRFQGRELSKKEFGYDLIKKITERLSSIAQIETPPKFLGRQLETTYKALKKGKNEKQKVQN